MYKYVPYEHQKESQSFVRINFQLPNFLESLFMITGHNIRIVEVHGMKHMPKDPLNETL